MELTDATIKTAISLGVCRLFCGEDVGTLWPKPTGTVKLTNSVMHIDPKEISFKTNFKGDLKYWKEAEARFLKQLNNKLPTKYSLKSGGRKVLVEIFVESDDMSKNLFIERIFKLLIVYLIYRINFGHQGRLQSNYQSTNRRHLR